MLFRGPRSRGINGYAAPAVGPASGRADLLPARDVFIEDGAWGPTHAISDKEDCSRAARYVRCCPLAINVAPLRSKAQRQTRLA